MRKDCLIVVNNNREKVYRLSNNVVRFHMDHIVSTPYILLSTELTWFFFVFCFYLFKFINTANY